jgi:hypothetical protein
LSDDKDRLQSGRPPLCLNTQHRIWSYCRSLFQDVVVSRNSQIHRLQAEVQTYENALDRKDQSIAALHETVRLQNDSLELKDLELASLRESLNNVDKHWFFGLWP